MTANLANRVLRYIAIYARLDMIAGIAIAVTLLIYLPLR